MEREFGMTRKDSFLGLEINVYYIFTVELCVVFKFFY